WEGWAILLRQKQKKLIMLPSETMIWQPEFTDKTLSRKPGAVHYNCSGCYATKQRFSRSLTATFFRLKADCLLLRWEAMIQCVYSLRGMHVPEHTISGG
ncbi:hypothetical protein U9Z92_24045, partial [Escherichia coli]